MTRGRKEDHMLLLPMTRLTICSSVAAAGKGQELIFARIRFQSSKETGKRDVSHHDVKAFSLFTQLEIFSNAICRQIQPFDLRENWKGIKVHLRKELVR